MVDGKERMLWQQTSSLMAIVVSASGNLKKGKKVTPGDFDPYYQQDKKKNESKNVKQTWEMMRRMYDKNYEGKK